MFSCCTNYLATMPDITVYMNCDTILAINLHAFELGENDEFIFVIKNYNYIDSQCVFLFRARKVDIDANGEVIFKIPPEVSKKIKPGAFYSFAMLINAFDTKKETEYKKLTENGYIQIEYGAHDLIIEPQEQLPAEDELTVIDVKLVSPNTVIESDENLIISAHLELID